MKTLNINYEYAEMICTRYVTPRVRSLSDYQAILKSDQADPLTREAMYTHIIVTCHQLITFLGIEYTDGLLNDTDIFSDKHYLQIDLRNWGGTALHVKQLANIQKTLLSEMLFIAQHIHYPGYICPPDQLQKIYLDKGGIDYLLLLMKQHFYDTLGFEFPCPLFL